MVLKVVIALTFIIRVVPALIAYDCRGATTNITVVSTRDIAPCPSPTNGYREETKEIQVIQKNDISETKVLTCLIEVTRLIQRCGMFSHASAVAAGLRTYIQPVGAIECRNIYRFKTYPGPGYVINDIKGNATTTAAVPLAGTVNMDGKCSGGTYAKNGATWADVIVSATLQIKIRDYIAPIELEANEISLMGGVTCTYTDGYCVDTEIGETLWEQGSQDQCSRGDYTILYQGIGNFITANETDLFTDSQYIVVEQENRVFVLTLVGKTHVCYQEAWITEHPRLMVVERKTYGFKFAKDQTAPRNTDLLTYINTKFMYVEQSYRRSLHNMYINMVHRRCLIQRETLKNRLLLAPLSPDSVSILLKNHPGYVGRVLGEVIYIVQCALRAVEIRRTNLCYNELPVKVDNESLFMAPNTHVLQEHGEQIECSHVTPALFLINNQWIGFSPLPQVYTQPEVLKPTEEPQFKFKPIQRLGTGCIYTNDEVREAQRNLSFGTERKAISNILTRKIIGLDTDVQGYNTVKLFNEEEVKQLAHKTVKQLWGWFTNFGLFISGMLGFYFVIRTIKYVLGTILNGISIYRTFGWSFAILASVWNTLTLWVLHREVQVRGGATNSEEDNDVQRGSEVTSEGSRPYQNVVIKLKECSE